MTVSKYNKFGSVAKLILNILGGKGAFIFERI
jgi:hypothetical protein